MAAERPLILSVIGTRPEAIKMAPLLEELKRRGEYVVDIVLTGQHDGLAERFSALAAHELRVDPRELSAGEVRDAVHHALRLHFVSRRADLVLIQGDTTSALAGALAARDWCLPIGHVEAGLRSGDPGQPWPEEINRVTIDELSTLLFAPSQRAAENLIREGVKGAIHVTGNTGIDALFAAPPRLRQRFRRHPCNPGAR